MNYLKFKGDLSLLLFSAHLHGFLNSNCSGFDQIVTVKGGGVEVEKSLCFCFYASPRQLLIDKTHWHNDFK